MQLTSINFDIIIHSAQLLKFFDYNNKVCCCHVTAATIKPASYKSFTKAYYATKGNDFCKFITYNSAIKDWNYNNFLIPYLVLTFLYFDSRTLCIQYT